MLLLTALLFHACSSEPEQVFVPGTGFAQSVTLRTAQGESATLRVGEPLVLHARRRTGPWTPLPRQSIQPGACWLGAPPPEEEPEVADNLRWSVEPSGTATFNVAYRADHTREVRFSRPGRYTIAGRSHAWCPPPYDGNALRVEVLDEPHGR